MKKELMEEKAKLGHDMRALHKLSVDEKRDFKSDETEKWAKMTARLNSIDAEIVRIDQLAELDESDVAMRAAAINGLPAQKTQARSQSDEDKAYSEAFSRLLRNINPGHTGMRAEDVAALEKRAQTTATGSTGGFTVAPEFGDRIIDSQKAFGGIANVATTITTDTGAALPFPANDDTGNMGAIIAENVAEGADLDLTFTQVTLNSYTYTTRPVKVPYELMQDFAFDLDGYVAGKMGTRLGRIHAQHYATGTGTGQPQGLTVGAGTGPTAAAAAAISFNDLVELEHSVDPAYRQMGGRFVFNDTTLKLLQKTVDAESRPLWLPGVGTAVPASIYGYPYTIDQGMPNVATGLKSVAFGLMTEYYIRIVKGIQMIRLVERYADFRQVGFLGYQRSDGRVMNSGAIKTLVHP